VIFSLLGLAGTAAATFFEGWMSYLLIGLSVLLLGRSFWILYVRKNATRATVVVTWISTVMIVGFWSWQLAWRLIGGT
jgi:hypothetical protein